MAGEHLQYPYDTLVLTRLRNFFHHRTPWQRRLWTVGSVVGLQEVAEYASVGSLGGANKTDGLRFVALAMRGKVDRDVGLGEEDARRAVADLLSAFASGGTKDFPSPHEVMRLEQLAQRCAYNYLGRWASAAASDDPPPIEVLARSVAAHLLDQGFSPAFLSEWVREHMANQTPLEEVILKGEELVAQPLTTWEVCIPLARSHPRLVGGGPEWIDATTTKEWLVARGHDAPEDLAGGYLCDRKARDPYAAISECSDLISRASSRLSVGLRAAAEVKAHARAYVAGVDGAFLLREPRRQIEVPNIRDHALLARGWSHPEGRRFDDAIELAAAMEIGTPAAAITGGWAAIESLLCRPGEPGVVAADRMAAIVAASWGRAELTSLAYIKSQGSDPLAEEIASLPATYGKARGLEGMIREGQQISLPQPHHAAALLRMRELVDDPAAVLQRVSGYMKEAFRRLYNQRNRIMHTGAFDSCALPTALRTAPPLVGAGLDRVAYAVNRGVGEPGLSLAARAENELEIVGTTGGRWIVDLLA